MSDNQKPSRDPGEEVCECGHPKGSHDNDSGLCRFNVRCPTYCTDFKPAQASKGTGDCPECGKGSLHLVPACKCDVCHVVLERGPLKFVEAHGEGHSKPAKGE